MYRLSLALASFPGWLHSVALRFQIHLDPAADLLGLRDPVALLDRLEALAEVGVDVEVDALAIGHDGIIPPIGIYVNTSGDVYIFR